MPTVHFKADLSRLRQFGRALEKASIEAVPYAIRDYCNEAAFTARREWIDTIEERLTLRNTWTVRSIQVRKAKGRDIKKLEATVGSIADYMDEQEDGDTKGKSGKHGVAIPTGASAGQKGAQKRTKVIRRRNYLKALSLRSSITGPRKVRNAAAMDRAIKSGTRVAFLELADGRKGLFRINGSRKRKRAPTMLYDLSRSSVRIPPSKTLRTALDRIEPDLPSIAIRAVMGQMNRVIRKGMK